MAQAIPEGLGQARGDTGTYAHLRVVCDVDELKASRNVLLGEWMDNSYIQMMKSTLWPGRGRDRERPPPNGHSCTCLKVPLVTPMLSLDTNNKQVGGTHNKKNHRNDFCGKEGNMRLGLEGRN